MRWTEMELKTFLEAKANYFENNIENGKYYDGLVLIISSHGIPNYLCTSDYKRFSKRVVDRTFSLGHPKSRKYPRFILYDCCCGDFKQERNTLTPISKNTINDISKNTSEDDTDKGTKQPWVYGEDNPDYMLGRVDSANQGFVAKMDARFGSHVIYQFYKKYMKNLQENKRKFIHEIFDEIQNELHDDGKQLSECTWNNDTRYIVFEKFDQSNNYEHSENYIDLNENISHLDDNLIEMGEMDSLQNDSL
eukprot:340821_1